MHRTFLWAGILLATLLSCEIPLGTTPKASLALNLPTSRAAVPIDTPVPDPTPTPDPAPGNDFSLVTLWTISGTSSSGKSFSQSVVPSNHTVTISGLEPGTWGIGVDAYAANNSHLFESSTVVDLKAGTNALTIVMNAVVVTPPSPFAGGTGVPADPYQVATDVQLDLVRNYPSAFFVQTTDIDLSGFSSGTGWVPIGSSSNPFKGSYSGVYQGTRHKIKNLTIDDSNRDQVGLFGFVDGSNSGTISGVTLENVKITANGQIGGLVGYAEGMFTIAQSGVTGTIFGNSMVGGLIGWANSQVIVRQSFANATLTGIGGIAPGSFGGIIGNVRTTASGSPVQLDNVFFTGDLVNVTYTGGGLVGSVESVNIGRITITNSYVSAGMGVANNNGGLIGYADYDSAVTVTGSFFNSDRAQFNATRYSGETASAGASFTSSSLFTGASWDFTSVWTIDPGKSAPFFRWMSSDTAPNPFFTGKGTLQDPYLVGTPWQLDSVRQYPTASFLQTANIDLSEYAAGDGWIPIGHGGIPFRGTYDGGSHSISNLTIHQPATDFEDVGLFGSVIVSITAANAALGAFKNIGLVNVNITAVYGMAGGLIGSLYDSDNVTLLSNPIVYNCGVNGTISGSATYMGGLIGTTNASQLGRGITVWGCSTNVTLTATSTFYHGGLIGYAVGTKLDSCSTIGSVTATNGTAVGGLVGWMKFWEKNDVGVTQSYSSASVYGGAGVGGLIGYAQMSASTGKFTITHTYTTGQILYVSNTAGGLIGTMDGFDEGVNLESSWTMGNVTPGTNTGGAVGVKGNGTVTNVLYNSDFYATADSGRGNPASAGYLQSGSLGAGFDAPWVLNVGEYPHFSWTPAP